MVLAAHGGCWLSFSPEHVPGRNDDFGVDDVIYWILLPNVDTGMRNAAFLSAASAVEIIDTTFSKVRVGSPNSPAL